MTRVDNEICRRVEMMIRRKAFWSSEDLDEMSVEEMRQIIHELRWHQKVHDAELSAAQADLDAVLALAEANNQLAQQIEERKHVEQAIQVERNKFRSILDAMPDGVYIVNQQYDIEYTNPVVEKEFGQVNGRKCYAYLHDRTEICSWCKNQDVFSGKSVQWEWHSLKTGKIYHRIDTPLFNLSGTISKLQIFYDITNRKQAEKELREYEKQLRNLSYQLLTAQETERGRIARELHDELGGALAVLKLRIGFIEKNIQSDQTTIREECKQTRQYIDEIINNVHRLSRDLSPSILEDIGLTPALKWYIDNFARHYKVKVVADIEPIDNLIQKDDQIMVYRTVQEALTNIGKHACANNIVIRVRSGGDSISFIVEDDGRGFDVETLSAIKSSEKGLGLASMKERAKMLGGSLHLSSEKGKGTRIGFSVPLTKGNIV